MEKRINPLELNGKEEVAITSVKEEPKQEKTATYEQPAPAPEKAGKGRCAICDFFAKLFKKGAKK